MRVRSARTLKGWNWIRFAVVEGCQNMLHNIKQHLMQFRAEIRKKNILICLKVDLEVSLHADDSDLCRKITVRENNNISLQTFGRVIILFILIIIIHLLKADDPVVFREEMSHKPTKHSVRNKSSLQSLGYI